MSARLVGSLLAVLLGTAAYAAESFSYRGNAINVLDAVAMTCSAPYELTHDCSEWAGAELLVQLSGRVYRVAGTEDGLIVLLMPQKVVDNQGLGEDAALLVEEIGAVEGARLERIEALVVKDIVTGYVLVFDQDVYVKLRSYALPEK